MIQDHYEILQVHPRADTQAIEAAYARLRELYDPARLEGAADELVELARRKRDDIERAYAMVGDPVRRAAYDAELAAKPAVQPEPKSAAGPAVKPEELLDYRPLPPARRAERPRDFDAEPVLGGRQVARPSQSRTTLIWLAGLLVSVVAISLALTGGAPAPAATPTPAADQAAVLDQFEAIIPEAQRAAQQNPDDPRAWIEYGNVLYDSVQVVREIAPDSPRYQQRLPRWLQATEAYSRALTLQPDNITVRADLGASSCFYGSSTGDQRFVRDGTAEVRRAAQSAPDDARVLISLGYCLVSSQPPQLAEAIQSWQRVVDVAPADDRLAAQARQLIARYSQ
jgi:cytochrome c-type biogenesis protein CcmH/NrfG